MKDKVLELLATLDGIEAQLSDPNVISDKEKYQETTRQHKFLIDLRDAWTEYLQVEKQLEDDKAFLKTETDPEFVAEIQEEIQGLEEKIPALKRFVETLLVPPDPLDHKNVIIEIRAGTGGDEAAIFVGDCVRMYRLFAESRGWNVEVLSYTDSDMGGFKEYQFVLSGDNVYRFMKYEAGTHRVQRVPDTETQGRVHTSAITVAVLIEPDEAEKITIDERDLRIDTYRSSGAGGQHVNTTDSAVRITHLPTGVVVHCQQERSQIKNRDKAMRVLQAKLLEEQEKQRHLEMSSERASQIGSGDRSARIRTYNFPQNRLTDHRINLTLYALDSIMEGKMDELVEALVSYFYQKKFDLSDA